MGVFPLSRGHTQHILSSTDCANKFKQKEVDDSYYVEEKEIKWKHE